MTYAGRPRLSTMTGSCLASAARAVGGIRTSFAGTVTTAGMSPIVPIRPLPAGTRTCSNLAVMSTTLGERLQAFVGRPAARPYRARDPVNQPMIRHWCDAVGDADPIYTDPEAAASSRHGGIVAPPAMLQAWTMRGLDRGPAPAGEYVVGQLFALLDEAGFTSVVA